MKAVEISRFGGPEVLSIVTRASQPVGVHDVRIQVTAMGLNFADLMMRMGLYPEAPKPPFTPGYEVSGRVTEVGKSVTSVRMGDRVVAFTKFGGYATEVVVPEDQVFVSPSRLTDQEAAAIPVNFLTAWIALQDMARVRSGDRVLVQSAAGGVGLAAVQIAAKVGAHVTGLVGSPQKSELVKQFGAKEVILNSDWDSSTKQFDIILDSRGAEEFKKSLSRVAPMGRVISFGASSLVGGRSRSLLKAAKFFANTPFVTPLGLMNRNAGVFGLNVLRLADEKILMKRRMREILNAFEEGIYQVKVGKIFSLQEVGRAHEYLQSGMSTGKVLLEAY